MGFLVQTPECPGEKRPAGPQGLISRRSPPRMRAASGRAFSAPGTIARMVRRAVICLAKPSSSAVPGWRKRV